MALSKLCARLEKSIGGEALRELLVLMQETESELEVERIGMGVLYGDGGTAIW